MKFGKKNATVFQVVFAHKQVLCNHSDKDLLIWKNDPFKFNFFFSEQKLAHIHNSQHNQIFWSFSNLYNNLIWSFWVASRKIIKIWIWGKKVQFIPESCVFMSETPTNSLFSNKLNFFSSNSNFNVSSRGNSEWPY